MSAYRCTEIQRNGFMCGRPAKARLFPGNAPICGLHARAAEARGEEMDPLPTKESK